MEKNIDSKQGLATVLNNEVLDLRSEKEMINL